jgi:hypothetical protein
MKNLLLFIITSLLFSCSGPDGPPGPPGPKGSPGQNAFIADVYELKNINFGFDNVKNVYKIFQTLKFTIIDSDVLLIYTLADVKPDGLPVWQQIPNTIFVAPGKQLNYDFEFTKKEFTIYARGNYDISTTPEYIINQTFRIVIVPGQFSKNKTSIDYSNYYDVIKKFKINDTKIKVLN